MIGVIGALTEEIKPIYEELNNLVKHEVKGVTFYVGNTGSNKVCVAKCNPGKVNAAMCTQLMIDEFDVDKIINIGVAGSVCNKLKPLHILIASNIFQYDYDLTPFGHPLGMIACLGLDRIFTNYEMTINIGAEAYKLTDDITFGTVGTGDRFLVHTGVKEVLHDKFLCDCVDMEAGAAAQTCYINKIPFASIKVISDKCDDEEYEENILEATELLGEIVSNYLRKF